MMRPASNVKERLIAIGFPMRIPAICRVVHNRNSMVTIFFFAALNLRTWPAGLSSCWRFSSRSVSQAFLMGLKVLRLAFTALSVGLNTRTT